MDLPYCADPLPLLAALRPLGRPVLLQSADPNHPLSRWDILAAAPQRAIETRGEVSLLVGPGTMTESTRAPFELLEEMLAGQPLPSGDDGPDAPPFRGGLLGIAGYDLLRGASAAPTGHARRPADDTGFPDLAAGLYTWAVVTDHARRQTRLLQLPGTDVPQAVLAALAAALSRPLPAALSVAPAALPTLRPEQDRAGYGRAFARIQDYIRAGDCYQVNLAVRFHGRTQAPSPALYRALLERQPAPFAGYLEIPSGTVLSLSPERLLHCEDRWLGTSPIKGTRARATDPAADAAEREALLASPKDRAENLMIVDLLRNDLGRSCEIGSVRVPRLFEVQSFASVHHLVSTVEGRLRSDLSPLQALAYAFPGGSITGAPKRRAMQIIDELEPAARGPYCGSLLRADAAGRLEASITIRSLLHRGEDLWCWGGGGVVADSDPDAEWAEIHHKVGALVRGADPDGG